MAAGRSTIMRPPPEDPTKSAMENVLEVTELGVLGPDIFTNTRQPWHPPGARGIFGGAVIAQCLASAQKTVPNDFFVHSCHCYFLLAGSSEIPILFHVERVRDGRSFATRTVQARQRGRCIFTTTVSFVKEGSGGEKQVRHAAPLPKGVRPPPEDWKGEPEWSTHSPFQTYRIQLVGGEGGNAQPHEMKSRNWVRARGRISVSGGHQAHLNALAYMSDSYFIGTVGRIHKLWRFPFRPEEFEDLPPELREEVERLNEFEGNTGRGIEYWKTRPHLGMMVSLDHSIYFHEPRRVRADEWMFTEMESPWSGEGRGVVLQKIFAGDGTLLATCVQEGVVRLKQEEDAEKEEPKTKL
ncbi:acyl-thioesterase ii [Colletotrichum musicola]|uniref:Acyl-thioesterase ii n=1 Tax=Colletotrichum musicola TaxID=2175873 RepID=A0A8H6U4V5_9PEZI|nr:acyl-thioesterase ii [Colletotrichum musicola]